MGGDSFEGTQKLTNQEYQEISKQLLDRLAVYCKRIEPYIPLPEKQVHGDIDLLVILKENYLPKNIIEELKMEKYIINNNDTINSVYKNKQVDFFFVKNDKQFQLASFYKSYSGVGAFLGLFLPSKQIKITPEGIFALGYEKHLKLEFLLCDQIDKMLEFYGLDYKQYMKGFKTRKELFKFLRNVRFLDEQKFAYGQQKNVTKLVKFFSQYLKQVGPNYQKHVTKYQNALKQTLQYFKKTEQYQKSFTQLINSKKRIQQLNQKFNATHLMNFYDVKPKQINQIKRKFYSTMFNNNEEEYYNFIQKNQVETILKEFQLKCDLKVKKQEPNKEGNSKVENKVNKINKIQEKSQKFQKQVQQIQTEQQIPQNSLTTQNQ